MDTGPPRREDEAEQIKSSHKDARSLLEPHPRRAGKRGKDQDIWGYHNTGESDLIALTIENDGPKKEAHKRKVGGSSGGDGKMKWEWIIGGIATLIAAYTLLFTILPGDVAPLEPSSFAIIRGMGHFPI